jgi:hypothetical protein
VDEGEVPSNSSESSPHTHTHTQAVWGHALSHIRINFSLPGHLSHSASDGTQETIPIVLQAESTVLGFFFLDNVM